MKRAVRIQFGLRYRYFRPRAGAAPLKLTVP